MALIQVPDIARKLARRFGIDGPAPADTLAPEIVPVVLVEDLTAPDEEDSGYERTCIGKQSVGALAANYSYVQLYNPSGSGVLVVVEAMILSVGGNSAISIRNYDTAATSLGTDLSFRDRRLSGAPAAQVRYVQSGANLGDAVAQAFAVGNDQYLTPLDFLLSPGKGLCTRPDTQNVQNITTLFWSERPLLSGES